MPNITVGDLGPAFALFNQDGYMIKLDKITDQNEAVIIYFYPQAGAPGCAVEAKGFRDILPELTARGVKVVGVTISTEAENKVFAKEHNIPFDLVSDPWKTTCTEWGVLKGDNIARMTFIVDPRGRVNHHFAQVNVWKHAAEVLAAVQHMPIIAPAAGAAPVAAPAAPAPAAAPQPQAFVPYGPPAAAPVAAPVAAPASVAAPVAQAAPVVPGSPAELIVATARTAMQLLLVHAQMGGTIPADVKALAQQLGR